MNNNTPIKLTQIMHWHKLNLCLQSHADWIVGTVSNRALALPTPINSAILVFFGVVNAYFGLMSNF